MSGARERLRALVGGSETRVGPQAACSEGPWCSGQNVLYHLSESLGGVRMQHSAGFIFSGLASLKCVFLMFFFFPQEGGGSMGETGSPAFSSQQCEPGHVHLHLFFPRDNPRPQLCAQSWGAGSGRLLVTDLRMQGSDRAGQGPRGWLQT